MKQTLLVAIISCIHVVLSSTAYSQTAANFSGTNGGAVILGSDVRVCSNTIEGAMRFSDLSKSVEVCHDRSGSFQWVKWG